MWIDTTKIVDLVWRNNITFYWQVTLLIRRIYDDRMKEQIDIIDGKWEDNNFVVNLMEHISKKFSRSFENKKSRKGDIRTDIFFKTIVMKMTNTSDTSKEKYI